MKVFITALLLMSANVFAKPVALKVDLSRHMDYIGSISVEALYKSNSRASGCLTYSRDIANPWIPKLISSPLNLNSSGTLEQELETKISHCEASLYSLKLKIKLDRAAVANRENVSRSAVDKNRIDFNYLVFELQPGQVLRDSELRLTRRYVAGSDEPKFTLSESSEAAPIVNGVIDLTL